jgi:UPF0755 protein
LRRILGRILLLLLVLLVTLRLGQRAAYEAYTAPGPGQSTQDFFAAAGGNQEIAAALAKAGIIEYPLVFRIAAYVTREQGPLRSGEYLVPARSSIREILLLLRHGPQVEHQVTIPEGLTAVQIAAILNAAPLATGELAPPSEGSVLPQTYDYLWNTPRQAVLNRAQDALQTALTAAWAQRDPAVPLNSPAEAVTLASIVQAEDKLTPEMPHIAGVYENRLRQGMRLQADPTVIYAASGGKQSGGAPISRTDLENPSPYNTYVHTGLPPGPICAPGMAAIEAVLHPQATNDLYFVANGTGGHTFSHLFKDQLNAIKHFWNEHE